MCLDERMKKPSINFPVSTTADKDGREYQILLAREDTPSWELTRGRARDTVAIFADDNGWTIPELKEVLDILGLHS